MVARKKILEKRKMNNFELADYYKEIRKSDYYNGKELKLVGLRKIIHPLALGALKTKRIIERNKLEILADNRKKKNEKPIIFAMNHIGKFDVEMASEAIKDHFYILFGDPEQLYRTIEHYFLVTNGVLYFDVYDKEDKFIAKERVIELLKKHINILWAPEGTWNLTPNRIVLPVHYGIIEAAIRSNSVIIPVVVEQYGKKYIVNIGKEFDVIDYFGKYNSDEELKIQAIEDLRNQMATLVWDIWETKPIVARDSIPNDYYENYLQEQLAGWEAFEKDNIDRRVYNVFRGKKTQDYSDVLKINIKNSDDVVKKMSYKLN
ncbi:MAG: hypothetical protein GX864_02000 [Mollicutes bacterium]|nr:hypothetical protein [Mollicutes bacterium]